ncbi:MAG: hemolysin family protein [Catenisphaera adipataccumulans]|uniref:hemolysin family protein n=1 Tax=Catenisphaera adipataccumulans TaxID=700500 RepID=UPI003D8A734C
MYILFLYLVTFLIGALCSAMQQYIDDEEIDVRNAILAETRWAVIFGAFVTMAATATLPWNMWAEMCIAAYLYILFAVQLPKRWANSGDHQAGVHRLYRIVRPVLRILALPVRVPTIVKEEVREEDIREMLSEGSDIDTPKKKWIQNVFEMDDTAIEEICTHRSEVVILLLDQTTAEWRQIIHDNRHTMYPVCREDEDDIIGILDTRDYFRMDEDVDQDTIINNAFDEPFFAAENTKIDALFHQMTNRKNYFCIVVDEYGGMTGIVTLHDIMESLVGEIYEEDDVIEPKEIQQIDANQWRIYGTAELGEVEEALGLELGDEDDETFNGYILTEYGHIPEDGSQFELDLPLMTVHVKEVKNHRIGQTIVQIKEEAHGKTETSH